MSALSNLQPWDIYDLSNDQLLEAYRAATSHEQQQQHVLLVSAMEKEMRERSLSYSVVHRLLLVGCQDGPSRDLATSSETQDADADANPQKNLPPAQELGMLRPPWFVDETSIIGLSGGISPQRASGNANRDEESVGIGVPLERCCDRPYRTMWDDHDDYESKDCVALADTEMLQKKKKKSRNASKGAAVMNKLGFFEVMTSSSHKLSSVARIKDDEPKRATERKPPIPLAQARRKKSSSMATPPSSAARRVSSSAALKSTGSPDSANARFNGAVGAAQADSQPSVPNTHVARVEAKNVSPEQGMLESRDNDDDHSSGVGGGGSAEPEWLTSLSHPLEAASPYLPHQDHDLSLKPTHTHPPGADVDPAPSSSCDDAALRSAPTLCRSETHEIPLLRDTSDVEKEEGVEEIAHLPAVFCVAPSGGDRTVVDQSEGSSSSSTLDAPRALSTEPPRHEQLITTTTPASQGHQLVQSAISKPTNAAAHSEGVVKCVNVLAAVPRPYFSSSSGAADYSFFFPTLAHLLVDPTHLFSFASQPIGVVLQAISMLAKSTKAWVDLVLQAEAACGGGGGAPHQLLCAANILSQGKLFKVQQDREEVRELVTRVLTDQRLQREPWIEIGAWEEEDDDDEAEGDGDDDDDLISERTWTHLLSTGQLRGQPSTSSRTSTTPAASRPGCVLPDVWTVWWTWGKPRPRPDSVWLATQLVNHIPKSSNLTRKDLLKSHVQRHNKQKSENSGAAATRRSITPTAHPASVATGGRRSITPSLESSSSSSVLSSRRSLPLMPLTFILPAEYVDFASHFAANGGTWILKTVGMSRGRGIRLVRSIDDVVYADVSVIQRYIDRPLLIDGGFKFDMRIYVLVTQFSPVLEAYVSTRGFFRIASQRYEGIHADTSKPKSSMKTAGREDDEKLFSHLTNTSISNEAKQKDKNRAGTPCWGPSSSASARTDCKWTLDEGRTFLEKKTSAIPSSGSWDQSIWQPICTTILRVLVSVQDSIPPQHSTSTGAVAVTMPLNNTFELFGFDVLLDEDLVPYVLEVNGSPSMECDGPKDELVKPLLINDIFNLLNPIAVDRSALLSVLTQQPETVKRHLFEPRGGGRRDLDAMLHAILQGRVPRKIGVEPPPRETLGCFQTLAPSDRYEAALKWKRSC